jgi:hypothetical protein
MCRITDVAPLHRVVVDIFQLLSQHRLGLNHSRVATFLPKLKGTIGLEPDFVILQAVEQSPHVAFSEVVDNPARRV